MRYLVICLVVLSGCVSRNDDEHAQADAIMDVYERDYGPITESQADCVHRFVIHVVNDRRVDRRCRELSLACYTHGPRRGIILLRRGIEEPLRTYTIRHELTHQLLWCVEGNMHADHQVPEFAYTSDVTAAGSLSAEADGL
jgi:hypothetical protein